MQPSQEPARRDDVVQGPIVAGMARGRLPFRPQWRRGAGAPAVRGGVGGLLNLPCVSAHGAEQTRTEVLVVMGDRARAGLAGARARSDRRGAAALRAYAVGAGQPAHLRLPERGEHARDGFQ
jgi:hypothetical protein